MRDDGRGWENEGPSPAVEGGAPQVANSQRIERRQRSEEDVKEETGMMDRKWPVAK